MLDAVTKVSDMGGYVPIADPPAPGVFEIGLVMAGAVSAGAYTAGVIDFLIEALDAWEAEKARCAAANPDATTWSVPGHSVRLRVLSGASAGSMTSAIAAVAFNYDFPHIRGGAPNSANPLYRAWVQEIDISKLLRTEDLRDPAAPVVSLLDSSALSGILRDALDYTAPAAPPRPYLEPGVRFIFTQGNLRGIPYFLELPGNSGGGLGMRAHADYQSFCIRYAASGTVNIRADDTVVQFPNSSAIAEWQVLGTAAVASGAFPIGLAPREIVRNGSNFSYRFIVVPGVDAATPAQVVQLQPRWADNCAPSAYKSVVVDGGTMNNEPLELARIELAGLAGRNPRKGTLATRASILIDPFPEKAADVDDPTVGQRHDILAVATALMGAWKDQARFDPVDLALATDENTYSRFLIAPDRGNPDSKGAADSKGFALACGALGGFSGFLCEAYRHHDYLLGRRNCQAFLRSHFALPIDNVPVMSAVNPQLKQTGSTWLAPGPGPACLPIIPLVGTVAVEEPLPKWPSNAYDPAVLRQPETARLDAVLDNLLRNSVKVNWFFRWAAKLGLAKIRTTLVDKSVDIVHTQLAARALV